MKKIICLLGSMLLPFGANAIEHGCAASAQSMFLACGFDVKEGFLENLGVCSDTSDADFSSQCVEAAEEESLEDAQECAEILASKLQICEKTQDAVHEVAFGEAFADNFVDPLEIGVSVDPNPWFQSMGL